MIVRAKIKLQTEKAGRYRVLCAECLWIMRLFEMHDVAAPRWRYTIRRCDHATVSRDAAGSFGWRCCLQ